MPRPVSKKIALYYEKGENCDHKINLTEKEYEKLHSVVDVPDALSLLVKDQDSYLVKKIKDTIEYTTKNFKEILYFRIRDGKVSVWRVLDKKWKSWLPRFNDKYTINNRFMWSFVNTKEGDWEDDDYRRSYYQGELEWFFSKISDKLPDCDFVVNHRDQMIVPKENGLPFPHFTRKVKEEFKYVDLLPVFSFSSSSKFKDRLFITPDDIHRIADVFFYSRECKLYEEPAMVNWEDRVPVALFRGRPTGFGEEKNVRIGLLNNLKGDKNFDIGITAKIPYNRDYYYRGKMLSKPLNEFEVKPNMDFELFTDYKYVIYADGNVGAYRLASLFTLGSVVIIFDKRYDMWCDSYFIDRVNCVMVKDYEELREAVNWLKKNDKKAEKIAKKGTELYETFLSGKETLFKWGIDTITSACSEEKSKKRSKVIMEEEDETIEDDYLLETSKKKVKEEIVSTKLKKKTAMVEEEEDEEVMPEKPKKKTVPKRKVEEEDEVIETGKFVGRKKITPKHRDR